MSSRPWSLVVRFCFALCGAVLALSLWRHPSAANVMPESMLIVHVQPVSGYPCYSPITSCNEIDNYMEVLGPVEVLIFFQPHYWQWEHQPVWIYALHCQLTWPESWVLLDFDDSCGDGGLSWVGPPYTLDLYWTHLSLPIEEDGVWLCAKLTLDATEPGWISLGNYWEDNVEVSSNGSHHISYPASVPAHVGLECDYDRHTCCHSMACNPRFEDAEMHLRAPSGGSATGVTILYQADLCGIQFESLAEWAEVKGDLDTTHYYYFVTVTADATELAPGTYETWVRAYNYRIGRCIRIVFAVEDLTATHRLSWGRIKALYR